MNTSVDTRILATHVRIEADKFFVELNDGREVGVPYSWFKLLANATPEQRKNWRLIGDGMGIHWEEIDEDISVKGILTHEKRTIQTTI